MLIQAVVGEICVKTCSEVIIILVQYGELMSALFHIYFTFFDDSENFFYQSRISNNYIFQTDRMLLKG